VIDTRPTVPAPPADAAIRELVAVREIAHAFLTADRPEEVYQYALDRVSPLVGATFASIYVVDGGEDLMRLAAAYNFPERFRPFLGEMRVRVGPGGGPSGEAAGERRIVRVPDVFADDSAAEWREAAGELGFRAIVALPLQTAGRVLGAVAFYFAEADAREDAEHALLRIVADQLAATAEKSRLIDDLRRANAALLESNAELERQYVAAVEARRLKDEFLSNMSHELRTPLTAVLGYAHLLQDELSGPLTSDQRRSLEQVVASSQRLLALIEDLFDLTALKRGELPVTEDTFDPRDAVGQAVRAARGRAAGVELRVDLPDGELPAMRADRAKIVRVLAGLLENAYKFTTAGEVRIGLEHDGDGEDGVARFTVHDTGIGIAPDAQQFIFEEFRQVDGSPRRAREGSGLGLALARQLARLLGGDIALESALDEGSRFTLTLPWRYHPGTVGS